MAFKCVPWNPAWTQVDRLDVYAIYRRPHTDKGQVVRDVAGNPVWDYVRLAVRRHAAWVAKGYEYVTLADLDSLRQVAGRIVDPGTGRALDWREFIVTQHPSPSPWDERAYLADQQAQTDATADDLKALVAEFGLDAVIKIKRQTDPNWQPSAELKAIAGKAGKK